MSLREYKWITIGSNKFKMNGSLIVCPLSNNISNVRQRRGAFRGAFGLITHIFYNDSEFLFVCEVYRTVRFDHHFQSFEHVKRKDRFHFALSPTQLSDYSVYQLHKPCFERTTHFFVPSKSELRHLVL